MTKCQNKFSRVNHQVKIFTVITIIILSFSTYFLFISIFSKLNSKCTGISKNENKTSLNSTALFITLSNLHINLKETHGAGNYSKNYILKKTSHIMWGKKSGYTFLTCSCFIKYRVNISQCLCLCLCVCLYLLLYLSLCLCLCLCVVYVYVFGSINGYVYVYEGYYLNNITCIYIKK